MGLIALLGWVWVARAAAAARLSSATAANMTIDRFPRRLGGYTLVRSWTENLVTGPLAYIWAQYEPAGGGTPVAIGLSPSLGWHDPLVCHIVRAEQPIWQGQLTVATAAAVPVDFNSAFYNDGETQYLEASTLCSNGACNESNTERTHFGFIYTHPDPKSLLGADPKQPIPVVVRAETLDSTLPSDVARSQLTKDLRAFLASVSLADLTSPRPN
jgi:exosortase J